MAAYGKWILIAEKYGVSSTSRIGGHGIFRGDVELSASCSGNARGSGVGGWLLFHAIFGEGRPQTQAGGDD